MLGMRRVQGDQQPGGANAVRPALKALRGASSGTAALELWSGAWGTTDASAHKLRKIDQEIAM